MLHPSFSPLNAVFWVGTTWNSPCSAKRLWGTYAMSLVLFKESDFNKPRIRDTDALGVGVPVALHSCITALPLIYGDAEVITARPLVYGFAVRSSIALCLFSCRDGSDEELQCVLARLCTCIDGGQSRNEIPTSGYFVSVRVIGNCAADTAR